MNFALELRNRRLQAGYTQQELAEKAHISHVMVAKYESGVALPTIMVAKLLADAVGTTLDELVKEEK